MRKSERVVMYAGLCLALALGLRGGHMLPPAWAAGDANENPLAVCGITSIIDDMMETDRFKPDRIEYEQEVREELLGDVAAQMQALEGQVKNVEPGGDEFKRLREQYFRLQNEASRLQQEVRRKVEVMVAGQLVECRLLVLTSAKAVADDLGFDYVITSENAEKEYERASVRDLVIDFLSRPVIVYPQDADITVDVREDLHLE